MSADNFQQTETLATTAGALSGSSIDYVPRVHLGHSEEFAELPIGGPVFGMHPAKRSDQVVAEFRQIRVLAVLIRKPSIPGMRIVSGKASPLKVFNSVVVLLAILVVYGLKIRGRIKKSLGDKTMNTPLGVCIERDHDVGIRSSSRDYTAGDLTFAPILVRDRAREASHPTMARHLIPTFKANNWFPNFVHKDHLVDLANGILQ